MRLAALFAFGLIVAAIAPAAADEDPLAQYLWEARPLVVFADSPKDPSFIRQMADIERRKADLTEREVVVLTDTDPSERGPLRKMLHPHRFMLVLIGKDGEIKLRRPRPMDVDALTRLIDRTPLRQQEIDERRGAS